MMSDNISTIYGSNFLLSLMPLSISIDVEEQEKVEEEFHAIIEPDCLDSVFLSGTLRPKTWTVTGEELVNDVGGEVSVMNGEKVGEKEAVLESEGGHEIAQNNSGDNQEINMVNNDTASIEVNGGGLISNLPVTESVTESVSTPDKINYCTINGYISRVGVGVGRADNDRQFVFCNGRPVDLPKFTKVLNEVITNY